MTFIDWFAGIGGFRRGMELAGHKCVGFCEFDKYAVMSYTSMHLITDSQREKLSIMNLKDRQKEIGKEEYKNGEWYANDIRRVYAPDIPRADVWCFGFPCQDISIAGLQKGFAGNRSSLFFRVMYLVEQLEEDRKPSYLFIENVKNLLSIHDGWDFAKLLSKMDENGYDAEWQVLDSQDFGVPQHRERVFIIGHLRGRCTGQIFPITGNDSKTNIQQLAGIERNKRLNPQTYRTYNTNGIAPTIGTSGGGGQQPLIVCRVNRKAKDGSFMKSKDIRLEQFGIETSATLMATDYKGATRKNSNLIVMPCITPNRPNKRQNGRRFKENGEPMFTLTAEDRHGMLIKEATAEGYAEAKTGDSINISFPDSKTRRGRVGKGYAQTLTTGCSLATLDSARIRRLTPKEYFRLQGWSDDYFEKAQFVNSDSQLYRQAGNGVTVNVIRAIAEKMRGAT